jgi:hypothetical protein
MLQRDARRSGKLRTIHAGHIAQQRGPNLLPVPNVRQMKLRRLSPGFSRTSLLAVTFHTARMAISYPFVYGRDSHYQKAKWVLFVVNGIVAH